MVPYWVALDFIQPSNDNTSVEDIGLEYFEKMVANSIFHKVDKNKYIMHDLFHDLAEKLSAEDCFRVTNAEREIPLTVQHVYLEAFNNEDLKKNLSSICKLGNLRTLIMVNPFYNDISEIISKISTNFKNLRVLDVRSRGYKILPRVVGDFRNLRLLSFWQSSIKQLPNSVSQLYHLQYLRLPSSEKTLPTELSNTEGRSVNTLPPVPYLGKLTSLKCLDEFHVRKKEGYELRQLGSLKEISGSLRILNLENVKYKDEAVEARLLDKSNLKSLELVWNESAKTNDLELEIEIIEALRPPKNLEYLTVVGYRGSTYPTWMQEGSFIKYIKHVRFYNCHALTNLPPNFHQFYQCSKVVLENLGALRKLSTFPENLDVLSIVKCPCLIFVCENELRAMDENHCPHKSFKQTGKIFNQKPMNFISECSTEANKKKLKLLSMLRVLYLGNCCVSDGALSDCLAKMAATLEQLYLSGITKITTLPIANVLQSLQRLRVVEIKECRDLRSLGGLHALPHLESFLVQGCSSLEMKSCFSPLPPTLLSFIIMTCAVSQTIFNGHLPCLQNIVIDHCHVESSLSFVQLTNLKSLQLCSCPSLSVIYLPSSFLKTLHLLDLPKLATEFVFKSWQGCQEQLFISIFLNCETKNLPKTLSDFSTLEFIDFIDCPQISKLPQLPESVQRITIKGCPELWKRCQPNNGRDWYKIQRIHDRRIE